MEQQSRERERVKEMRWREKYRKKKKMYVYVEKIYGLKSVTRKIFLKIKSTFIENREIVKENITWGIYVYVWI